MILLVLIFLWPAKDLASVQISVRQRVTLITMFCLGVIICIAGVCRVWYISIYISSWDFLCTYHPFLYDAPTRVLPSSSARIHTNYPTSPTNTASVGHGTVLFVIICIETSIGIICGCLPGCKPLFAQLFPSIFAKSSTSNSQSKKPPSKNVDGRPFPFQIVKEEGFEVRYGEEGRESSSKLGTSSSTSANWSQRMEDGGDDAGSGDSREWIMLQKGSGAKLSPV
jgi:hypothetical protein